MYAFTVYGAAPHRDEKKQHSVIREEYITTARDTHSKSTRTERIYYRRPSAALLHNDVEYVGSAAPPHANAARVDTWGGMYTVWL